MKNLENSRSNSASRYVTLCDRMKRDTRVAIPMVEAYRSKCVNYENEMSLMVTMWSGIIRDGHDLVKRDKAVIWVARAFDGHGGS